MLKHVPRLHLRAKALIFVFFLGLLWLSLPYDNTLVLMVRWHFNAITGAMTPNDRWTSESPPFPTSMDDVAMLIKTGFSTQERLVAKLKAISNAGSSTNIVLVGDYSTSPGSHFSCRGIEVPVYDALAWMINRDNISLQLNVNRLKYYGELTSAIAAGDKELALSIGETHGWELDIMKHVSGLELGYKTLPDKKWYVLLDDDTYILEPSLKHILEHLDSSVPHYFGNAIGGPYITRFAHGGSAIVISQEAMRCVFIQNSNLISAFNNESLTAGWGDALVANTLMKNGIYLEERYAHHFNGEPPRLTRIRPDRFCTPIVSFHSLGPEQMNAVGIKFRGIIKPVSGVGIWNLYEARTLSSFLDDPFRAEWDHVGRLDQSSTVTTNDVQTKEDCLQICLANYDTCLAWTWEQENHACHVSPWIIVGNTTEHRFTGINTQRAITLASQCLH